MSNVEFEGRAIHDEVLEMAMAAITLLTRKKMLIMGVYGASLDGLVFAILSCIAYLTNVISHFFHLKANNI